MGLLTDVFAATDAEVAALGADDIPLQKFPGVEAKQLDPVKFATLQNIVVGTDTQDAISQHELVLEVSEKGPWITVTPTALFDACWDGRGFAGCATGTRRRPDWRERLQRIDSRGPDGKNARRGDA